MKVVSTLTVLSLLLLGTTSQANEPRPYEAVYQAKALGISATATRRQSISDEQQYTLENSLSLVVLGANVGSVTETSEFVWNDSQIVPLHYRYVQTGISASNEEVFFDWNNSLAISQSDEESWEVALSDGVLDKLSFSVQIGQDIAERELAQFQYNVVDEDKIDEHLYRISSEEVLETPLGKLNTIKIERVRAAESRRRTTVWLAKDWDYLLVRLEQVSGSGTETQLSLESATMDGEPVTGL